MQKELKLTLVQKQKRNKVLTKKAKSKKRLIVISGATAIGKTALSIRLAQHFNTEIISGTVNISEMSVPELVFSNLDINYESDGVPGANFSLEGSVGDHIQLSDDELLSIQQQILQSGKLPNGTYIFTVSLKNTRFR